MPVTLHPRLSAPLLLKVQDMYLTLRPTSSGGPYGQLTRPRWRARTAPTSGRSNKGDLEQSCQYSTRAAVELGVSLLKANSKRSKMKPRSRRLETPSSCLRKSSTDGKGKQWPFVTMRFPTYPTHILTRLSTDTSNGRNIQRRRRKLTKFSPPRMYEIVGLPVLETR